MLVILAYGGDVAARKLVERWRAAGERAGLLTVDDCTRPGWRYRPGADDAGTAVVQGELVATREIRAVITRMPAVAPAELVHVHEDDRMYAASEIGAFLLAWLSSLRCPVLNRPEPCNLGGRAWTMADWITCARSIGVAAAPLSLCTSPDAPADPTRTRVDAATPAVDVVGTRAFLIGGREAGPDDARLAEPSIALARAASVELLRVHWQPDTAPDAPPVFLEASAWIDLAADAIADAVTERCLGFSVAAAPHAPGPKAKAVA